MKNSKLFALVAVIALVSCEKDKINISDLRIDTDGNTITYIVEEAISQKQKEKGLMFRKQMPEQNGMVFFNNPPRPMTMWMKNTIIPLDMLFAGADGKIVCIFENTTPYSEKFLPCTKDVALVLELNAGQVQKHKIKIGDKISHRLLNQN